MKKLLGEFLVEFERLMALEKMNLRTTVLNTKEYYLALVYEAVKLAVRMI